MLHFNNARGKTSSIRCREELQRQLRNDGYLYLSASDLTNEYSWFNLVFRITQGILLRQEDEEHIHDVRSDPNLTRLSDSRSSNPLRPHTDGPYYAKPPHWLVLYCRQEASCGGGVTKLVDGFELLRWEFSENEQAQLMKRPYTFSNKAGTQKVTKPILQANKGADLMLRYSHNALAFGKLSPDIESQPNNQDTWLQSITERVASFCNSYYRAIRMQTGSILICNNHRFLHYRSGFTDTQRHLQRLWMSGSTDS